MISFLDTMIKNSLQYERPKRSQVYVGFQCHQKCGFCYYKDHFHEPMFPKEKVLIQIDLLLAYGITDFEITGGEPSECLDLRFYCEYIKNKLPSAKIAIITNGGLYNSNIWDLIDEVLISYHISGNDKEINKSIFPNGHTYNKVIKTIQKARELNKFIRTNTIIAKFNIKNFDLIVEDLIQFKPNIINFLPVNLFDDAENYMQDYIDYNIVSNIIKKSINTILLKLPEQPIFVRYMPYCNMEGYEKYIVGTFQHIFDWFDWNRELCGTFLFDLLNKYNNNIDDILKSLGRFGSTSFKATDLCRNEHYEKSHDCLKCKYNIICDGVEKTKEHKLLKFIKPVPGKIIKDVNFYLKDTTYNIYNRYYDDKK